MILSTPVLLASATARGRALCKTGELWWIVDTSYPGIRHSKYWMPIYYDTIEEEWAKQQISSFILEVSSPTYSY